MKRECLSSTYKARKRKIGNHPRLALLLSHPLKNISRRLVNGTKISIWLSQITIVPIMDLRESTLIDPSLYPDKAMPTEEKTSLIQELCMLPKPQWDLWHTARPFLTHLQLSKRKRMILSLLKEVTGISLKRFSNTWQDSQDQMIMVTSLAWEEDR